jgi:hypothetical protein
MESVSKTISHARLPRFNTQLRTPHGEGAVAYSVWSRKSTLETMSGQLVMPTLHSTCSFQTCRLRRERRGEEGHAGVAVCTAAAWRNGRSAVLAQIWCQICEGHSKAVQWVNTILPYDLAIISRVLESDGNQLLPGGTGHTELLNSIIRPPLWLAVRTNDASAES